jgi:ashwin
VWCSIREHLSAFRSSAVDGLRKRPLIVFDGSSTSTSIKVKRTENGADDRLKPLAQIGSTSDAFWKSPNSSSRISPLVLFSNLPVNHKMEHNNNDTQQNHDLMNRKSPSGPVKSPPLSPVGTTPVKLKRAAPKEEAEATVSVGVASTLSMALSIHPVALGQLAVLVSWGG